MSSEVSKSSYPLLLVTLCFRTKHFRSNIRDWNTSVEYGKNSQCAQSSGVTVLKPSRMTSDQVRFFECFVAYAADGSSITSTLKLFSTSSKYVDVFDASKKTRSSESLCDIASFECFILCAFFFFSPIMYPSSMSCGDIETGPGERKSFGEARC